uniref:Bifunctional inhibitor/plant lipid transfer protein/seed storage helical domain-containing protein n=1 Tax=Ananas comosus var. bracteatus TaxID=296719 RepID=A0A6V7NIF6_ANACO|nr:unnamed protein product [Ananas comosus var. bracteatus]
MSEEEKETCVKAVGWGSSDQLPASPLLLCGRAIGLCGRPRGVRKPAGGSVAVPDLRGGQREGPTPDCCKGLQEVVAQSFKCLCVLVKDRDEPALGFKFNVTRALFLPSMCQVPANVTDCPRLLNLPANSADAQVFEQFGRQLKNISNNNTATDDGKGHSTSNGARSKMRILNATAGIIAWMLYLLLG